MTSAALATLLTLALDAPPAAAGDRALAVDLTGIGLDQIYEWDLANPGVELPVLAVTNDFVRGLVADGPTSGWFVSSASEIGGPTGVYRFENGAATKLNDVPGGFSFSGADATWAPGGSTFYYVIDPQGPQGYTLYRVALDGAWAEIAELSDPSEPDPKVSGIAVHPATGVLYAYEDRTTPHLSTVSTTTGVMTPVGDSGLPPYPTTVIMSMDFTSSGELVLVENSGTLHGLDPGTGQALPPIGQMSFPTAAIAFLPDSDDSVGLPYCSSTPNSTGAPASLSASGSVSIAANDLALEAASLPAGVTSLFFYGSSQLRIPFGDGFRCVGGEVYRLLPPGDSNAGGVLTRALDLPAMPGGAIQVGETWNFQAWYRDPAAGGAGFNLSGGLSLTFAQ